MEEKKVMQVLSDVFRDDPHRKDWQFMSRDESEDETIMRRVVRDAREMQLKYRACGQTTLLPLVQHLHLGSKEVVLAATTLTGGFGGDEICGALVGGITALGLEFGREDFSDTGAPRMKGQSKFTYAQARSTELRLRFKHLVGGSHTCRDIQISHFGQKLNPTDRSKPEVLHRLQSGELFSMWSTFAVEMVGVAAALTCEIILRERRKRGIITPLMPIR